MLTPSEIAAMRAQQEQAMPSTMQVLSPSRVAGPGGRVVDTWTAAPSVACRLYPRSGGEEIRLGGRLIIDADAILTVPATLALSASQRVLCQGITYQVLYVEDAHPWSTARRAALRRVQ